MRFAPRGRVLELAAGTGQWTAQLADHANELLVTDASPEMLELNRARVGERQNVSYQVADAFAPALRSTFDAVFFGFFLSHVPPGRFAAFWGSLEALLAPGGRVFIVDEADHGLWEEDWIDRDSRHRAAAADRRQRASGDQGHLPAVRPGGAARCAGVDGIGHGGRPFLLGDCPSHIVAYATIWW